MKSMIRWNLIVALSAALLMGSVFAEEGFEPLFDGKSLEGWDGNPAFWSVRDGAITGQTTAENPTKGNTFLVWRKGELDNFELRLQFRIVGGNSGIQYRSREVGKWVIAGYQADFDGGNGWTGTLYEEKGRGVLARRGDAVEIAADGAKSKVGQTTEQAKIVESVKKEDWNEYRIVADGNHLEQYVNGLKTVDVVDHQVEKRAMKGLLALQLHAGPPMTVQFKNIRLKKLPEKTSAVLSESDVQFTSLLRAGESQEKKVVFVAGRPSHGYGSHEHYAGCLLLAKSLQQALPHFQVDVVKNGWPADESVFEGADAVVMYADGGGRHPVNAHLAKMDDLAEAGVGVACIHYGVEVPKGPSGDHFLKWIGGYFETNWSVNPHWTAKFDKFPDHPVANGVKPFEANDEWYYHMRFRENMEGVTPILSDLPGEETLARRDGPHSGNPHVRAAVLQRKERQHVAWVSERPNGQRGFGFTGGHNHWNWGEPNFRKVVLNAIVWVAHGEVPADGVSDKPVTVDDLLQNQDYPKPRNLNLDGIKKRFHLQGSVKKDSDTVLVAARSSTAKPVYSSKVITSQTPGHATAVEADIAGAKKLFLVANDGGNGYSCDWVAWGEPRLVGPSGEKKLTELKWKSASTGHGQVNINKNSGGQPMRIAGAAVPYGIGTHANSVIEFDLPAGYTKFLATAGLDNGGTDQGNCGDQASVQFQVYTKTPPIQIAKASGGGKASRDPADAVANLDVADGLEAVLFASEPMVHSISNIDIDHRGRVWVCEILNYRGNKGRRPEGDRILILEDTDRDGVADKSKTFYQGRDIDSPHGVCVLGTPTGKGTKVIVSAGDKVQVFTDVDGDDKPDQQDVLFSGISGTQHDHGIHAFVFGPDGKLYFNFGNSGRQLKDKDGKPIIDKAGNEIVTNRKPYQEGLVFRCDLDGSNVETLGWNFRNNWMATVDSFGTIWQSDNDDDGNKGVRINYVMEFGNYGYKDELTGAGWKSQRTNLETEVPKRHWHLNDPGVVPNLLQTGQGSPTGITVYEGDLLPEVFRGQVIHCDAGPSVCRAYPVTKDGAGYSAETVNVLYGARDNWFRPSDVSAAVDGSLMVADWYDPGVGGHRAGDLDSGRIFRVAPPGTKYNVPEFNFATAAGAVEALKNPNYAVRYVAWTALHEMGAKAEPELLKMYQSENPRFRARALWLLGKIPGRGDHYVNLAIADKDADIRITGIRLARQIYATSTGVAAKLVKDPSPQVRREVAIALSGDKSPEAPDLWAELAAQHDGQDRWYLEALGIGARGNWDACFAAWLKKVGDQWSSEAGKDIVWRSRATATPEYLAKIVKDPKTPSETHPRYMRAFDFLTGPEKDKALQSILLGL